MKAQQERQIKSVIEALQTLLAEGVTVKQINNRLAAALDGLQLRKPIILSL